MLHGRGPPPGNLTELDATNLVEVVTGVPIYDAARSKVRLQLQVGVTFRSRPVHGRVRLAIVGILNAAGPPTAQRVDPAGSVLSSTKVSFAGKLDTADMLAPRGLSETVEIVLKGKPEAGFDTAIDFRVKGHVTR